MDTAERTSPDVRLAATYRRALVTGGAGFIGSHLVERLLHAGLDVVSLDDFSAGKESNLVHLAGRPELTSVKADVSVYDAIRPHFEGVDVVFHLAASKNTVCMANPARDLTVNAGGTLNTLHAAKDAGVRRFVHASTGSVYGEPLEFPTDEDSSLRPVSYYGVSKLAGEAYALLFNTLHGMDMVVLRYFHVYGPRQDNSDVGGVVSIFCRRAHEGRHLVIYGDGTQIRSFTYVGDVVSINLLAAVEPRMVGCTFNCASGARVTIQELAEKVLANYQRKDLAIEYRAWKPGDIRNFQVDNSRLRALGFVFEKNFDEGLEETIEWTRAFLRGGESSHGAVEDATRLGC